MTEDNSTDSKKSTPDIKPVRSEAMVSKSNRPIGGASMLFTATLGFINLGGLVLLFFWFFSTSDNQQQAGQNFIERISVLEESLDEQNQQNQDIIESTEQDLKFINKEIRKLWDLSNKKNRKVMTVINKAKISAGAIILFVVTPTLRSAFNSLFAESFP